MKRPLDPECLRLNSTTAALTHTVNGVSAVGTASADCVFALWLSDQTNLRNQRVPRDSGNPKGEHFLATRNLLVYNCYEAMHGYYSTLTSEHLTANMVGFAGIPVFNNMTNTTFSVTNSLLTAVTNLGTYGGSNNAIESNGTQVYQAVGAGSHYLASASPYRNAGTTNINS